VRAICTSACCCGPAHLADLALRLANRYVELAENLLGSRVSSRGQVARVVAHHSRRCWYNVGIPNTRRGGSADTLPPQPDGFGVRQPLSPVCDQLHVSHPHRMHDPLHAERQSCRGEKRWRPYP
jgi:hypothetical protein